MLVAAFFFLAPRPLFLTPDLVAAAEVLAGAAKLELTPPRKTPLAGYSRRHGTLATGVHDAPYVRAIVMRAGDATVAVVSCDLLIIDETLFDAVKRRVEAAQPGGSMTLLIAATHTHSGPGAYGQNFLEKLSMGHFDPAVFDFLSGRIAEAVAMAASHLAPVTMRYAKTTAQEWVVNRMEPSGVVDPELAVLAFDDEGHRPIAVIANFSAHPTTLGSWNLQMSADYPGVLAHELELRYPTAVCLFLVGAVGDQGPVKQGDGFDPPARMGQALAQKISNLLGMAPDGALAGMRAAQRVIPLPPARLRFGWFQLPSSLSRSLADDDATLTVVAVGPVVFIGVPCDLSAELGLELKRHAKQRGYQPVVVGFADDYIGYCLPERLYQTPTYEAFMAFNGPTTGSLLVNELKRMIDQLDNSR